MTTRKPLTAAVVLGASTTGLSHTAHAVAIAAAIPRTPRVPTPSKPRAGKPGRCSLVAAAAKAGGMEPGYGSTRHFPHVIFHTSTCAYTGEDCVKGGFKRVVTAPLSTVGPGVILDGDGGCPPAVRAQPEFSVGTAGAESRLMPAAKPKPRSAVAARPRLELATEEAPFEFLESKIQVPALRPGTVSRTALVNRLRATTSTAVTTIIAPAGYGKTTLLSQWAARDARTFAWVTLDERDNDPIVLLRHI